MRKQSTFLSTILCLSILGGLPMALHAFQKGGREADPFSVQYEEGPVTVAPGEKYTLTVRFQIPEKYYLYGEMTDIVFENLDGISAGEITKPDGILKEDPFFGRITAVYYDEAVVEASLEIPVEGWPGEKSLSGEIQYQGCSDKLCYRLMHLPFQVTFVSSGGLSAAETNPPAEPAVRPSLIDRLGDLIKQKDFSRVTSEGIWLAFLVAFIGGVLTDLTPCVWPMIPVTLAIIGVRKDQRLGRKLLAVGVMVLGMSVMYSLLGLLAAGLGLGLGFLFQSLFFLVFLEMVLILMALSLLGLFDLRLPASLQARLSKIPSTGFFGIFFVGLTMGFFAAPCVGPVVGPLLIYVAKTKDLALGFWLLFFYALGMGVLFLLLALFHGAVKIGSGVWNVWLKRGLGVLMILVAIYYGGVIYAQVAAVKPVDDKVWITSLDEGLARSAAEKKPMVVDFFAQWCLPCIELDRKVWGRPGIRRRLAERWVAVKIDCTKDTEPCRQAVDRFGVIGWPTVVFLDEKQEEVAAERLTGTVVTEGEMEEILERVEMGIKLP